MTGGENSLKNILSRIAPTSLGIKRLGASSELFQSLFLGLRFLNNLSFLSVTRAMERCVRTLPPQKVKFRQRTLTSQRALTRQRTLTRQRALH